MRTLVKLVVLAAFCAVGSLPLSAANFTLTVAGDQIFTNNSNTTIATIGSTFLFVVDTQDSGFGNLTPGSITAGSAINSGGSDIVIGQFTLSDNGTGGGFAILSQTFNTATIPGWTVGDPLAIYWIPSLSGNTNTVVGSGVAYGKYTDPVANGNSDPWTSPSDSATVTMYFETDNSGPFAPANAAFNAGFSNLTTVPEPSTFALLGGVLALGAVLRRRLAKVTTSPPGV